MTTDGSPWAPVPSPDTGVADRATPDRDPDNDNDTETVTGTAPDSGPSDPDLPEPGPAPAIAAGAAPALGAVAFTESGSALAETVTSTTTPAGGPPGSEPGAQGESIDPLVKRRLAMAGAVGVALAGGIVALALVSGGGGDDATGVGDDVLAPTTVSDGADADDAAADVPVVTDDTTTTSASTTTEVPETTEAPETTTTVPATTTPPTTTPPTTAPPTTSAPTTTPPTTAPAPVTTVPPPAPNAEVAESFAIIRDGQIFLEGAVPNAEAGEQIAALAAEILGPENVFNNYVVDPNAGDPSEGNVTVEDTINFATDSAALLPESEGLLNQALALMTLRPAVTMEIVGHTDSRGTPETNQRLSEQRAEAVKQWLVDRGIDPARIVTRGAGSSEPIADDSTPEGRRLNRRIQFFLDNILGG